MTKFWIGAAALLLIGLAAIFSATGQESQLKINDLETECRYDRSTMTNIQLNPDNSLHFEGHFPVENTNSNLDYSYSSGNSIILNIESEGLSAPVSFWDNCLATGVYDMETGSLEAGTYSVELQQNGERLEKRIIRVKD